MKLFEITAQFKELEKLADEVDPDTLRDTLEGLEGDFEEKVVNVARMILNIEADSHAAIEAGKAIQLRGERLAKQAERMKHYVLLQMQIIRFERKIKRPELSITRRNNPPSVQILNQSVIPDEFWREPEIPDKVIDKRAIKAALDRGENVPGAFQESGERIEIKV